MKKINFEITDENLDILIKAFEEKYSDRINDKTKKGITLIKDILKEFMIDKVINYYKRKEIDKIEINLPDDFIV